jgi:hypothetical protein
MENHSLLISVDALLDARMLIINGEQALTDCDLANLLQVNKKYLLRRVRSNRKRFPPDFLIELNNHHSTQTSITEKCTYAFTWGGIMQAVALFKTKRAVNIHLQLIRCYVKGSGLFDKCLSST